MIFSRAFGNRLRDGVLDRLAGALLYNRHFSDAARRQLYAQGVIGFVARTADGRPVLLETRDRSITDSLMGVGEWQPAVAQCATRFAARLNDPLLVLLGANVGVVGAEARAKTSYAHTIAVEPNPGLTDLLRGNLVMSSDRPAKIETCGVGAEAGRFELYVDPRQSGAGSLLHHQNKPARKPVTVEVERLETILRRCPDYREDRACVFVVDVEGLELDVLEQIVALSDRRKAPCVAICEFAPAFQGENEKAYRARAEALLAPLQLETLNGQPMDFKSIGGMADVAVLINLDAAENATTGSP